MSDETRFDRLLKEIPRIAKAVSELPEEIRPAAFQALVAALAEPKAGAPGKRSKSPRVRRARSRPKAAASEGAVRPEVKDARLETKGLISWEDCKKKGEKILWILAATRNVVAGGLQNQEISWLLRRNKNTSIPPGNMRALLEGPLAAGQVVPVTIDGYAGWVIEEKGIKRMASEAEA